jgi:hypothetical protein
MASKLVDLSRNRDEILANWDAEIVTLLPGDML